MFRPEDLDRRDPVSTVDVGVAEVDREVAPWAAMASTALGGSAYGGGMLTEGVTAALDGGDSEAWAEDPGGPSAR